MPPKRVAHAQALRESFTEANSCAVVERWATETIGHALQVAQEAAKHRGEAQAATYTSSNAQKTPQQVVDVLQRYQSLCHCVFTDAEQVRTVIAVRIPELKEEDNLGVAVQNAVLKMIDEIESKATGGSGGEKSGGVAAPAGMYSLREYLTTRGGVEEKIIGKPDEKTGGSSAGSKSPSVLLELRQVDADALMKVELAAMQLATVLRSFVNAYALNWKKLIEPRSISSHMVS
ncbi:proteasome activator protein PA26 [Trypanosoma grayi]|uniref:proteasome activator protein PA26 n=1 Tax=Trypanosoma grayi TaxID=71804 RepID=UPI0004F46847|nr:proteasome activator protein PA26 [Trypanosoma grayi]KEG09879.1 proteasome activator protein PA26 [Trypanosoma grayi]